jgi:hypothetical protein
MEVMESQTEEIDLGNFDKQKTTKFMLKVTLVGLLIFTIIIVQLGQYYQYYHLIDSISKTAVSGFSIFDGASLKTGLSDYFDKILILAQRISNVGHDCKHDNIIRTTLLPNMTG